MRAQACSILLVSGCARRMPNHLMTQLNLRTFYSSSSPATFARRRCMPIQLDLCQHGSACGTIKRTGQLRPPSADQPLFTAFDPIHKLLGKRMTHGSLCQYSCVHASTSLLKFDCVCLRSLHARSSQSLSSNCAHFYSSTCLATFARRRCMPIQLGLCQHSSACGTIKCAGQLSPLSADQPRFHSFCIQSLSCSEKRMTRGSRYQYSCVHASTSLPKFACACLRLLHARSSQSSARVVRTLLVNLPCNVCTAPLHANTTRSMPTQLCMRHHQTRRSAQSALSRSAAFYSF